MSAQRRASEASSLRAQVYRLLDSTNREDPYARALQIGLIGLIALNIVAVTLETLELTYQQYQRAFDLFDAVSVLVFTIEYGVRLWVCVEDPKYRDVTHPRWRYAFSPMALIDLAAVVPFYLAMFVEMDLRFLRALRLLRVFKLTRYSSAMSILLDVLREEASSFLASFFILFVLLVMAASGAYLVEHQAQPDKFGSIPHAMWWAMATLTTVGYGDVTPITPLGKLFGGVVIIIGVGMAALPAGIFASGLVDHLHQRRDSLRHRFRMALHDGTIDPMERQALEHLRIELGIRADVAQSIQEEVMRTRAAHGVCVCPNCGTRFER